MRALMICNPNASAVTPARRRVVERALETSFDLDVADTTGRGHATRLAREAAEVGAKAVVVFGGDGTANETINGLLGDAASTDVIVGVLPGGGTNVLARSLGYPSDVVDATGHLLDLADTGAVRRIGVGRARTESFHRVFTQSSGLGLDAETVRRVDRSGLRRSLGDLAYVWSWFGALRAVRRAARPPIELDGTPVWWAVVGKADPMTYWGRRPLRATPHASRDRSLNVVAARSAKRLRTVRWGLQALGAGGHVSHRDIVHLRDVAACRFTATPPVGMQADGEYLGMVSRVEVEVLADALPVYAR